MSVSATVFKLVLLLTFNTGESIEAWDYTYPTEAQCISAGKHFVAAVHKEDPNGFYRKVEFECRSKGVIGKKISVITKHEPWR